MRPDSFQLKSERPSPESGPKVQLNPEESPAPLEDRRPEESPPAVLSEQKQLRDRIAVVVSMLFLVVPLPLVCIVSVNNGHPLLLGTGLLISTVAAVSLLLLRREKGHQARQLLLLSVYLILGARALVLGGVFSLAFLSWPIALIVSALFFGRRGLWLSLIVGVFFGFIFAWLESSALLPTPITMNNLPRRLGLSIVMFTSFAALIDLMTRATEDTFLKLVQSETARQREAMRYQHAAAGAHHGVWDCDITTGSVWLDPGVGALLGDPEVARIATVKGLMARLHPDDFQRVRKAYMTNVESIDELDTEYRVLHSNGNWIWVHARGRRIDDRVVGFIEDVDETKSMERELRHRAFHDSLTGLPNRDLFLDRLGQTLNECRRRDVANFAVVFIDLDRFKVINDSLGHAAGDVLLIQLAGRLKSTIREPDTVARLGGDEFTLLLRDIDNEKDAHTALQRIQNELKRAFIVEGQEVFVGASMGLVLGSLEYKEPQDLLRDADLAMYSVKRDAQEDIGVFENSMRREMRALLELDTSLRRALEQKQIIPWYQPIVDLRTGETIGFEALARWVQANGDVLGPNEFIERAEETGLIAELDRSILEQASTIVGAWNQQGASFLLSVNLSARQFHAKGLKDYISSVMKKSGLKAGELQLEITEGILLSDAPGVRGTLSALDALGVRVAFDDFGTGYSSLSYLHRFDIEVLKIDRAFVQEKGPEGPGPICHAIHSMAQSLGIQTVAEGIETTEQCDALLKLGCSFGQGYLFGAAKPHHELEQDHAHKIPSA